MGTLVGFISEKIIGSEFFRLILDDEALETQQKDQEPITEPLKHIRLRLAYEFIHQVRKSTNAIPPGGLWMSEKQFCLLYSLSCL